MEGAREDAWKHIRNSVRATPCNVPHDCDTAHQQLGEIGSLLSVFTVAQFQYLAMISVAYTSPCVRLMFDAGGSHMLRIVNQGGPSTGHHFALDRCVAGTKVSPHVVIFNEC